MSALFDRAPGIVVKPIDLTRSIEIRDIPFVFPTEQALYPHMSNDYSANVVADLYRNLSTYWMYTAAIQLTLNGPEPAWSRDGWSFVPVKLDDIHSVVLPNDLGASKQMVDGSHANVSFTTPALRGRIECSQYPTDVLANTSNWLLPRDLTNHTYWDSSTIPRDERGNYLEGGYELGALPTWTRHEESGYLYPLNSSQQSSSGDMGGCPGCTTTFVNPSRIICCGNGSSNAWDPNVAVGYWSPNTNLSTWTPREWHQNFTAKWFYGNAVTGVTNIDRNPYSSSTINTGILFPEPPSVSLLNCRPLVESAEADITVNAANGDIQSFNIITEPKERSEAFADNFLPHNKTQIRWRENKFVYNVTLR